MEDEIDEEQIEEATPSKAKGRGRPRKVPVSTDKKATPAQNKNKTPGRVCSCH